MAIRRCSLFLLMALLFAAPDAFGQNSTSKIRVVPNEISAKIGTAINWESDFDNAMKKALAQKKPVFWYVPRLEDTFMDRKKEVDRYMRAGPFSYPRIIASINEHYIPLMAVPKKREAETYELVRYKFIEPGFLILGNDGTETTRLDRITTMHEAWLSSFLKPPTSLAKPSKEIENVRNLFSLGWYDKVRKAIRTAQIEEPNEFSRDELIELKLIDAMSTFRMQQHDAALKQFGEIGKAYPDHPLGWKAAAEAQRIGPFVRGFEVFSMLTESGKSAGRKSAGSAAPAGTYSEEQLWRRGVGFLLTMQNERGGFEDSDYDFGGTDGLPNVHVAVTSIAATALLEAHDRADLEDLRPRIAAAIRKAAEYVSDESNLNTKDKDEIFWAYLYRLRFFNRLHVKWDSGIDVVADALKSLQDVQTRGGDWYHEYNNPFVTASALWAMKEAESIGVRADPSSVEAGIAALKKCRYANGAWSYGSRGDVSTKQARPGGVAGSAGRMPLCEGAMLIWDRSEDEALMKSLALAFEKHDDMDRARKYDDHTSSYSYGGFFYWYCMQSRSEAILQVAEPETRKEMATKQREIVLSVPEIDGCFVDSHEIGRSYGTAMALLCLQDCKVAIEGDIAR